MELDKITKNPKKYAQKIEIEKLVEILQTLSDAYYNTEQPLVSDKVYDTLIDVLRERDPGNEFLKKVGSQIKNTKEKVTLPFEMGSLSKIKPNKGNIDKWLNKYKGYYFVSDKLDGASIQVYKNQSGKVFLFSRGDGTEGQDITPLLKHIITKETLSLIPNGTSIRGELIISIENFKKLKDKMENARNAISGLINSKTINVDVAKIADFVTYAILNPRYDYKEQMDLLCKWKLNVVNHMFTDTISEDFLVKHLVERKTKTQYEMDGIVVVDCSKIYPHQGGYRDHEFAFKMITNEQIATTKVIEVIWEPSKDGYLKPRIKIEPVNLVGVTITYATAFNAKFIVDNKIGPNATIKIIRSGDVIPYIYEVVEPAKEPQMPPFPYKWNSTNVDLILKDENDANGKQIISIKLLEHFFSKIGVKYLSEGIITKLVENGYDSVVSILRADKKDLVKIDGIGEKMVDKIYSEIDRGFEDMSLETFMAASNKLGRGMGERKIAEIIKVYPNILNEPEEELYDKIMEIKGFSDISTKLFVDNLKNFKQFYKEIAKVKDLSRFENVKIKKDGEKFVNQIFVFTGFRDKDLEKYILENGGKVTTSVSSKTTMLIYADDSDTTSSKFVKAIELKIKLIKKSDFISQFTDL